MGKKQFCFFQTAETGNRTPDSGVKGSGANHYPRAPAQYPLEKQEFGRVTSKLIISENIGRMINLSTLSQSTFRQLSKNYTSICLSRTYEILLRNRLFFKLQKSIALLISQLELQKLYLRVQQDPAINESLSFLHYYVIVFQELQKTIRATKVVPT